MEKMDFKAGMYVIVRTYRAGVFAGKLVARMVWGRVDFRAGHERREAAGGLQIPRTRDGDPAPRSDRDCARDRGRAEEH